MSRAMGLRLVVAALALAAAGCGGSSGPVPDVVGERLDVAKSKVADAGFDTEDVGGGAFGIVVESNWTVCKTDPPAGDSGTGTVRLIVDRSCSERTASVASDDADVGTEPEPTATPKKKRKRQPVAATVVVPNVLGMNHQAAQNRMQAAGLYNLRERDGTGQGRLLIWDRNWIVVDQRPSPGTKVSETTKITVVSVKEGEQ